MGVPLSGSMIAYKYAARTLENSSTCVLALDTEYIHDMLMSWSAQTQEAMVAVDR